MIVTDVFGGMWTAVGQLFDGYGGILIVVLACFCLMGALGGGDD